MSVLSRLTLLAITACCASAAHAVGLGPIELRSYLNEPLRADVALQDVAPERLDSISARVASESAYEELGLSRNDYLGSVEALVVLDNGQPVVRLRGNRALQEPLLELLVVVREGRQLVQRNYTLFVDPPQFAQQREPAAPETTQAPAEGAPAPANDRAPSTPAVDDPPAESAATTAPEADAPPAQSPVNSTDRGEAPSAPVAAEEGEPGEASTGDAPSPASTPETPTVVAQPSAPPAVPDARRTEQAPRFFTTESERELDPELLAEIGEGSGAARDTAPATSRPTAAPRSSENGIYPVRRGETLWRVAVNTRPQSQGITMQQMMLAIVQTNPKAFENGDATELLAGARLRIPDAARIKSVSPADAKRQMRALLDGERTTQQAAAAEPAEPASTAQAAVQAPEDEAPAEPAPEPVDDSDAASDVAALDESGPASEEEGTSSPAAPSDSEAPADTGDERVSAAEGDMAQGPDAAAPDAEATDGSAGEADASADASPSTMDQADADTGTTEATGETVESEVASQADGTGSGDENVTAGAEDGSTSDASTPSPESEKDTASGESAAAASGPGGFLGLPWYLLLVIAGVVLLGAAGILEMRRRAARRASEPAEAEPQFANLTGQSADAGETDQDEDTAGAAQATEEEPSANTQAGELGETAADDPLADADFRIAYGMYDDAASRLSDAISRDPENATLRLKLAEVYCAADDKERFLDAADAAARTGLSEAEERELADMASRIAPDSRFATAIGASMTAGTVFAESHAGSAPASDEDTARDASEDNEADDFASVLGTTDESPEPGSAADLEPDATGGGAPGDDAGDVGQADDDLAFGDDVAAEIADPSETDPSGDSAAEPGGEDNVLDFDLDNLEFGDEAPAPAAAPSEASEPTAEDEHALDFDLEGLDLPETPSAAPEPTPAADDNALDFEWETPDSEDTDTNTDADQQPAPDAGGDTSADAEPSDTATPASEAEPPAATPKDEPSSDGTLSASEIDAGDFDLDEFSLEDFDVDSGSEIADSTMPAGPSEDPPTLDLPEPEPGPGPADGGGDDAFALDDFEIEDGDDSAPASADGGDGVAGQLDLARAYVDMGEGDMARPLLEEVLQSGDEAQRQEAQRLLDIAG